MLAITSNELRFKSVIDNANDIIFTHIDGVVNYVNNETARITGYLKEEMIGQAITNFISPKFIAEIKAAIERRIAGDNDPHAYQVEIIRKDGIGVPVEVKSSSVGIADGHNEFVIVARDITDRLKQEEAKQRLQDFLQIQLDLAIKISKAMDINQIFSYCLDSAMQASDMDGGGIYLVRDSGSVELMASKGLSKEFLDQVRFFPAKSQVSELASYGIPRYTEAANECKIFDNITCKEGLTAIASFPIKNDNRIIAYLNLASRRFVEISQESKEFLEIITSNIGSAIARAESESFKQQFLSGTTHELKTPLTSICGAAEFLDHNIKDMDPLMARMITLIRRGAKRMLFLINNILNFSQIESDIRTLHKDSMDLGALINMVVEDMQHIAMQKEISLSAQISDELIIQADKNRIEQVLINLISNAIKFTSNGGHVEMEAACIYDHVQFSVKDDGVGITPEEMPLLFTRFGKIERKDVDVDIQGTGLGLFISRSIIEMHGGKILVESEGRFKGSKFTVLLPKNEEILN